MIKKRLVGYLVAVVTLALNYAVFYWLAVIFGSKIPHFIAGALTSALFIHELMHLVVMEACGIPAFMIFLVILGGAGPLPIRKVTEKEKKLSWEKKSAIVLAGVAGNFGVILGAYFIARMGMISWDQFSRVVNLNSILILWNLFPIGKFDGGHFSRMLFDSISENRDTKYEVVLIQLFIMVSLLLLFLCKRFDALSLALFSWGIHYRANHDDINGSHNRKAIPESHQKWWAAFYLLMISIALIMSATTPTWLINP